MNKIKSSPNTIKVYEIIEIKKFCYYGERIYVAVKWIDCWVGVGRERKENRIE